MKIFPKVELRGPDGDLYLTRWVLFNRFGFKIFLHHIHRSDWDRHLHDHPWPFVSFLLKGSYSEWTQMDPGKIQALREVWYDTFPEFSRPPDTKPKSNYLFSRVVRWINLKLDPTVPHRLQLDNGPVWSLVFIGRKVRSWGFHTEDGFVDYVEYLDKIYGKGNWAQTADVLDA